MDVHKVRIFATTLNSTTGFICQFTDKTTKKLVSLVNDGRDGYIHHGDLSPNMEVKTFILDKAFKYEFLFDRDNRNDQLAKNYFGFWTKDPRVFCKSGDKNPNYEVTHLILEDLTAEQTQAVVSIKDKRKALMKYETLSLKTQKNVAYYFGVVNADTLSEDQLYVQLADPTSGTIMQAANLEKFLAYNADDENIQLQINTRRAIEKGIVEQKDNFGKKSYFINNHPIGDNEESVIAYLDLNQDFYFTYIVEKLGDLAEVAKQEAKVEQEKVIETIDVEGLRKRVQGKFETLQKLEIKGAKAAKWAQYSGADAVKKLQEADKEADQLIAEKQSKMQPA